MWILVSFFSGVFLLVVYVMFIFLAPASDHLTSEAEGYVSRVEMSQSSSKGRNRITYLTYVTFTDSDGQTFTARSVVNGSKRHSEGDQVTVHFDPRDPEAGCLIVGDEDRLFMFNALRYISGIGGALAVVVSVGAFLYVKLLRR